MEIIPPIQVTQGLPFDHDIVWEEDGVPVNMTGWTGTFTVKAKFGDDVKILTSTPVLGAAGEIAINLTATDTAGLPVQDRQGPVKLGFYQIMVTNGATGNIFQGDFYASAAL
jgi:hypothetical protein